MSVASLLDALHVVGTADEIESFFNVLLHNAIRYCPHNMELHVPEFIRKYFVDFTRLPTGALECPETKVYLVTELGAVKFGQRVLTFGTAPDEPNEALNMLIPELLSWFKARYQILEYERLLGPGNPSDQAAHPDATGPPARRQRVESESSNTGPAGSGKVFGKKVVQGPVQPSAETYELAANLKDHSSVRDLFWQAKSWKWPENEMLQDHLHVLYPLPSVPEEPVYGIGSTEEGSVRSVPVFPPVYSKTTHRRAATASGTLPTTYRYK